MMKTVEVGSAGERKDDVGKEDEEEEEERAEEM